MKTLVLVHGWGADGSIWQKQVPAFQSQLQVETPTITAWDPAWMGAYLQKFSLPECLLVGWSLGGMLLLEVLARQPAKAGGLVLVGAPAVFCSRPDHPWGQSPAMVRAMRRALNSDPRKVLQDFSVSCLGPGEDSFKTEIAALFTGSNGADLANGLDYLLNQDLRLLLADLPVSPAIIQGDQDRIVPPEQARFLQGQLPGSRLHLLPGAGHLPFWTQNKRFNEILADILNRRTGS
jgi:pimeloyl-[acyl-carrier protein] methyl ester esterase